MGQGSPQCRVRGNGASLGVQWLRLRASTAGGWASSIPGWGNKDKKKKKEEMKVKDRPKNSCTGGMVREREASTEN